MRRDDARAVERTAVIVLSYVYVNGLEAMQCYAGLNLTLCDDRQVWRANIMPAAMPGGVQSIQPTRHMVQFCVERFRAALFYSAQINIPFSPLYKHVFMLNVT